MEKKLKFIAIGISAVICFSAIILVSYGVIPFYDDLLNTDNDNSSGNSESLESVYNISLYVDYGDITYDEWVNFSLDEGKTTVLDALLSKCDCKLKQYSNGYMVIGINGVEGDWIYYVNGKYAGIGAADYNLQDEDYIKWEYIGS